MGTKTLEFKDTKFWTQADPALKNATWYTSQKTENQLIQTYNA